MLVIVVVRGLAVYNIGTRPRYASQPTFRSVQMTILRYSWLEVKPQRGVQGEMKLKKRRVSVGGVLLGITLIVNNKKIESCTKKETKKKRNGKKTKKTTLYIRKSVKNKMFF